MKSTLDVGHTQGKIALVNKKGSLWRRSISVGILANSKPQYRNMAASNFAWSENVIWLGPIIRHFSGFFTSTKK